MTSGTPVPSTSLVPTTTVASKTPSAPPGTTAVPTPTMLPAPTTSAAPGSTLVPTTTALSYDVTMQMTVYPDPAMARGQTTVSGEATSDDGDLPIGNVAIMVSALLILNIYLLGYLVSWMLIHADCCKADKRWLCS